MRFVLLCILLASGSLTPVHGQQPKTITNSIGMKLVLIPAGSFTMGSPEGEVGRQENETSHKVTISKSFYLCSFEVTQDLYGKVTGSNPSQSKAPKNPVDSVSWEDAVSFCKKLSELPEEKAIGRVYRLPTEAEWEFACRAGGKATFSFGDSTGSLKDYAWTDQNSEGPHPVGEKKPNRWGLYDMHGNVWEWCEDWYAPHTKDSAVDPLGPSQGPNKVFRGGSWIFGAIDSRSAVRFNNTPTYKNGHIGFRVAMSLPAKKPEAATK